MIETSWRTRPWESTVKMQHNNSGRFESRFPALRVEARTPGFWFKGMAGSVLGIWSAHGEGKFSFSAPTVIGGAAGQLLRRDE